MVGVGVGLGVELGGVNGVAKALDDGPKVYHQIANVVARTARMEDVVRN